MEIEYHHIGPGDAALLAEIAPEVFDEPIRSDRLAAYLDDPTNLLIVAMADGHVIAQCAAVIHRHPDKPTELYIDEVGVSPAFLRRGIAREMMRRMFALGKSCGCDEAWVGTDLDNEAANRLYEGFGASGETFKLYEYEL